MFFLCGLLTLMPPPPGSTTLSADQVLQRSQRAYDSVRTLEETVAGSSGGTKATAHIYFARPAKLRVSGTSLFSSRYDLLCDGRTTSIFNGGAWATAASPEMGIATITGISGSAGSAVPAALIHASFGNVLQNLQGHSTVGSVKSNGRTLFKIHSEQPFPTTAWIDSKSCFLVKTLTVVIGRNLVVEFDPPKINQPIAARTFVR